MQYANLGRCGPVVGRVDLGSWLTIADLVLTEDVTAELDRIFPGPTTRDSAT